MTWLPLIGALVAAVATAAVSFVLVVRARSDAARQVDEAAAAFAAALGRTGELAASLDPDEVAQRILETVAMFPGVDAVVLDALDAGGKRTRAARGVSKKEAERIAMQTPANSNLRTMGVVFQYRLDHADKAASFLRAGLVVPLVADGMEIGTLAAFTRTASTEFPEETVAALERLALRAGPALNNAHHFVQARLLADTDSLTGLQNRRCFHERLAREISRASRYERRLSLIVFDLDDFKSINDSIGHLNGDAVLAEVAARVRSVVRSADIAGRVGGDEFAVIMPESGLADGELIANRIADTVAEHPFAHGGHLYVSAGVAELRAEDGPSEIFGRADTALYRAKQAGKGQAVSAD